MTIAVFKLMLKNMNLIVLLTVHFGMKQFQCDIFDYYCLQVDRKDIKNMKESNLIVILKTHTGSSFWKEAVPM